MTETLKAKIERHAKNLAAELAQDGAHGSTNTVEITIDLYGDGDWDIMWTTAAVRPMG